MIDVRHTQITLGDRRSRFTNDLDSSRTILIGGNRHEGFSSEPTEKQNLTMNREYPRANGSTLVNHNFPSSSSYCQGRGRLSQRGGHDDYRVLRISPLWICRLLRKSSRRDARLSRLLLELLLLSKKFVWLNNNGCQCL